jgi:hypothetical protein
MFPGQRLDACGGSGRGIHWLGAVPVFRIERAAQPVAHKKPASRSADAYKRLRRLQDQDIQNKLRNDSLSPARSAARLSQTFGLEFFSSLSAVAAASFNPASMRSHSRPYSGPVLPRDLTEPSRFKNSFAPIRLLRIFILQLLRGDLCNTISYQTDATCLTRNWA